MVNFLCLTSLKNLKLNELKNKIENNPVKWNAQAKVGSFDNISYKPGGGAVKIETLKLNWDAKPRINTIFEQKELFTPRTNQVS